MAVITAPDLSHRRIASVGTWDGVHRGHASVLRVLVEIAGRLGAVPTAVTFSRHPLSVVRPERVPPMLSSLERRVERLQACGAQDVVILPFDDDLRSLTAEEFLKLLRRDYSVEGIVVGHDNSFGADRPGDADTLRKAAEKAGVMMFVAKEWQHDSGKVCSSVIRRLIASGEMGLAAELLGYPYELDGVVVDGKQIGRTIGFPTANVSVAPECALPASGVYACRATIAGMPGSFIAIVNIGSRPTVDCGSHSPLTIEAHLLDFNGDIYGKNLTLFFVERLRSEKRFPTLEALAAQLAADACLARKILDTNPL